RGHHAAPRTRVRRQDALPAAGPLGRVEPVQVLLREQATVGPLPRLDVNEAYLGRVADPRAPDLHVSDGATRPRHAPGFCQWMILMVARVESLTQKHRGGSDEVGASRPRVVVLDYGSGNLRSAQRALARIGADAEVTADFGAA